MAGQQDWSISRRYKVFATPYGFVINENGVIDAKGVVSSRQYLQYVLSESHRDLTVERNATRFESEKELTHA